MIKINPNLQTLAQLCTTPTSNWLQGIYAYNEFLTFNTNQGTGTNIIYPSAFLTYVLEMYGENVANQCAYIYKQIIYLFAHSIPYDQTTQTYNLQGTNNNTFNFTIPDIFYEIDSYFSLYQNNVLEYVLRTSRLSAQIKMTSTNMSAQRSRTQGVNTNLKDSNNLTKTNVESTSFNPITNNTTIQTNPIDVATPTTPSMSNTIGAQNIPTGTDNTNVANWTQTNVGKNENNIQDTQQNLNEQETYQNLQTYNQAGRDNFKNALRPLIKKIASLFWHLGNDYYPDNTNLGFNIW